MQMIRQNTNRDCFKWIALLNRGIDSAQPINLSHKQAARPVFNGDREEKHAAVELDAKISDMAGTLGWQDKQR
jgi:hypothetical protein